METKELSEFVDEWGECRNADGLGAALAREVLSGPVVLSWCDNAGTRLTVQFALPTRIGYVPGFGPVDRIMWVAVEGYGNYGFAIKDEGLHPGYVSEKLGKSSPSVTWELLAELLSDLRRALAVA